MKKSILFAMFIGGVFAANAQIGQTSPGVSTGTATLNVKLHPIQTLIVKQTTVNLDYKTVSDYEGGVSSSNADHLTLYSTGAFEVMVSSTDDNLKSGSDNIASVGIKLTATEGTRKLDEASYKAVGLSKTPAVLVESGTSGKGGFNKTVNVEYTGAKDYIDNYKKGAVAGDVKVYTTTVTYTIAAK